MGPEGVLQLPGDQDGRITDLAAPTPPSTRMDTGILAMCGLKGLSYVNVPNLIPGQARRPRHQCTRYNYD